ncbi:MAG: leucine--tRNA ligase [Patescibacteria group bacterium]
MTIKYPASEIEAKWQKAWSERKTYSVDIEKATKPFYNLMMFPYPSAEGLHVGNMYAFTGTDIYGRFKRMQGFDVFEPIGLDGFGIHSENYAFKVGKHPVEQAKRSEKNFYRQLSLIGCMYDWTRTIETYDPQYYRWTQWLFVEMFRHGLAYRAKAEVNWCPSCKTVLADEQVIEGKCERCGNIVEKRSLEQWFFRITAYAGKLLENIPSLKWSEKVLIAQKNWIGKKEGINITYPVVDEKGTHIGEVSCFTTRPDTNYGATFVVLAPEHPFISTLARVIKKEKADAIGQYITATTKMSPEDRIAQGRKKTGIATGLYCLNQLTGYTMPLYVSDFVVMGVGTGAVVGVPGHDLRDFEFAQVMKIPAVRVVVGPDGDTSEITKPEQVQEDAGTMIHSEFLDGMVIADAITAMMNYLEKKGWGKRVVTYHLRDWLISRQRYWGPPIPMIYCQTCEQKGKGERSDMPGWYTVADKDLPVELPVIDDYKPGDDGIAPLAKHKEFYETLCPGCGGKAVRETDVSDTFLDSSWYFLRYPSVGVNGAPFDKTFTKKWLPVTMYTGGAEHSVLHLMYSRFIWMCLYDWGYFDFSAKGRPALGWEEPFPNFFAHGLVIKDGAKMSKSKGNVVNPDEYIKLYGTDALRMYLMFMGPFSEGGDFRDSGMEGMARWVGRIWRIATSSLEAGTDVVASDIVIKSLHKTIRKVGEDTDKRHYNTAIAATMEFTNLVADEGGSLTIPMLKAFLLILAPYAPHLTEELWSRLGGKFSIHHQPWPTYDPAKLVEETIPVVIQVNGKLRDTLQIDVESASNQEKIEATARSSEKVQKFIKDQTVRKVIFVPARLINFVI